MNNLKNQAENGVAKFDFPSRSVLLLLLLFTSLSLHAQIKPSLSSDDFTEILQLYFQYPLILDSGDGEAFADLFTEDGSFGDRVKGRQALLEFATREPRNIRHASLTPLIIPTENGAKGVITNLFIDVSQEPAVITRVSQYTDELVKTQNGWKFKSRKNGTADLREGEATKYQDMNQ